jgi:hypothetical protein
MKVEVKQEHIDKGVPSNGCECPIALALGEMFPDAQVLVCDGRIEVGFEVAAPPQEAKEFINDFDDGEPVAPFSFDLDIDTRLI